MHDNCLGILLLDTGAPNAPTGWEIERNRVVDNNRVCPPAGPAPPQSGAGIVLAGASDNTVAHNVVKDNVPAGPSPFAAGGIVLVPTLDFGGSVPTGNLIKRNLVERKRL